MRLYSKRGHCKKTYCIYINTKVYFMKNFDWTRFQKKIAVKSPMQKIYDAWTVPSELEKWFLKTARFFDESGLQLNMEDHIAPPMTYEFTWYLYPETERGKVLKANGKDRLEFTFAG